MPFSTYAELQDAVANWLLRSDLASTIPDFIALAEADLGRKLRTLDMEARVPVSYDAQFADLPSDWVATVSLRLTRGGRPYQVDLISRAEMMDRRGNSADVAGDPVFYSVAGSQIELFPTPSGTVSGELLYIQKIPALSDANTSNWLLQSSPDAYLYGALLQSAPFLKDDERIPVWAAAYENAIVSINDASRRAKTSGVGARMKIRGLS